MATCYSTTNAVEVEKLIRVKEIVVESYTLTLTPEEAKFLKWVMSKIGGREDGPRGNAISIGMALCNAKVEYKQYNIDKINHSIYFV